MKLTAPADVIAVSIGTVHIDGPEADIDDPQVAAELVALGWTETKAAPKKKSE